MINVDELLYELELSINKVSTLDNLNVETPDLLILLNRAQIGLIKSFYGPNNVFQIGFEETRKRIDDLQDLKTPSPGLPLIKGNNQRYKDYVADLAGCDRYMFYIDSYITAKTKNCDDTLDVNLIRENELNIKYFSENHKPSFPWRETIATIGGNKLHVYTDGSFTPLYAFVTYIRYPKTIDKEGYVKLDGTQSVNQDSELPEYLKADLIDLAVKYYSHFKNDQLQAQLTQTRINTNE